MDKSISPLYIGAISIIIISFYAVKYESYSENECSESVASWIPKLERLDFNQSRIVKRCSPTYSDIAKVKSTAIVLSHISTLMLSTGV